MAFLGNFLEKMIENVERFQTSVAVCVAVGSSCSKSAFFWITHPEPSFNCHVHWIMFIVVSVNCFLVGFSSTNCRHRQLEALIWISYKYFSAISCIKMCSQML